MTPSYQTHNAPTGHGETPEWFARALCRGAPTDLWFPHRGEQATVNEARAICARCPVAPECRDHALDNRELFGIWGGTTELQRRRLRRKWRRTCTACGQVFIPAHSLTRHCPTCANTTRARSNQQ